MEINFRKQQLLEKYLNNNCSRAELEELFGYLESDNGDAYESVMKDLWNQISEEKILEEKRADHLVKRVIRPDKRAAPRSRRWYRLAAAAVLMLLIASGSFLLFSHKKEQVPAIVKNTKNQYKNDIKPGSTKAILRAGNMQVTLNEEDTSFTLAGNVVHVNSGNVKVANRQPVKYTLIVPRGGIFSLVLADGTKVWLNADSKLFYPSLFSGNYREVSLEGEAYFKVKTDPNHPFVVHTKNQDIKVLGTEFNVHAYLDEGKCITTLIKGEVRVNSFDRKILLKPGQQITSDKTGRINLQKDADTRESTAWKNGYFLFNNTGLREVMRRLSRWYNINVTYEEGVNSHEFMAIMSRDNSILQILDMLEATGAVHFKIKEKEVIVMP